MLNVGTPEMLVILVVALLVLGPNKLPEVARQVGKAVGEIRRLGAGFGQEPVDDAEDVGGLLAHALAGGLVRDLAGQIDGVAVHDGLGHARADADTLNAHNHISLNGHRRW